MGVEGEKSDGDGVSEDAKDGCAAFSLGEGLAGESGPTKREPNL